MASYYEKAFSLAKAEERFQVVRPWWDLMSQMTIQFTMIIAVTSISLDVFSQFGSGIKCTPRDVKDSIGIQQYFWVNSACIENSVSFYVEYFGYVMFIQCLLLLTVDNFWLNWSRSKNRLKAFNDIVQEVTNSVVKRESIKKNLTSVLKAKEATMEEAEEAALKGSMEGEEEAEEENNVELTLANLVSSRNQVKTAEAEDALRLNEKLGAFFKMSQESTLLASAYRCKTVLRLILGLLFFFVSLYYLIKQVFDFDFPCDLPMMNIETTRAIKNDKFWCVNVTATFSRMLVYAFLLVIFINICVCVVALIGWNSILHHLPEFVDDGVYRKPPVEGAANNKTTSGADADAGSEARATFRVGSDSVDVSPSGAGAASSSSSPFGGGKNAANNDVVFLLHLLYQTDESVFREVLNFASSDFHHELLEYLSNRAWPLDKLKSLVRPPPAMQSLRIIDANLILIPPAVRHMANTLVEIDCSSNNHLFDISNLAGQKSLKYLKLRGCNVRDISGIMEVKTLVRLDVSNNKLARIPDEIVGLTRLVYLYVKDNRLRELPPALLRLPALNYLSVETRLYDALDPERVFFDRHPIPGHPISFLRQIGIEAKTPDEPMEIVGKKEDAALEAAPAAAAPAAAAPAQKPTQQPAPEPEQAPEPAPAPVPTVVAEDVKITPDSPQLRPA